jgi:hypothetical protein
MDNTSLEILLEHGLWKRCGNLRAEWQAQRAQDGIKREGDKKSERTKRRNATAKDRSELDLGMIFWLTKQAAAMYPYACFHFVFFLG